VKKAILFFIFCILVSAAQPAQCAQAHNRGLFVTVVQEPPVLSSREDIDKLISFCEKTRISILFVQVYRANQAWFPSKIADSQPYNTCFKNVSQDPLRLLIKKAHASGIKVHAWLNMLSLSDNKDAPILKKYGPDILTKNLKEKKSIEDYKIDDQYFLEPGDIRVRSELTKLVGELLQAYPELDGIQFDYIRYPDKDPDYGYTKMNTSRFKKSIQVKAARGAGRIWKDWKRAQVTGLLELLVKKARSIRANMQVSATGCMPYSRAYHEAFQDWPAWLDRGLVDFVTIMSYSSDPQEFESWISTAKAKTKNFKKVNIGIGAYKLVKSPELFEKEFRDCEKSGAFIATIFHYGSLAQNPALSEFLIEARRP
jgi:uncharacterized lipoprotein YddW (UPF0748 family)